MIKTDGRAKGPKTTSSFVSRAFAQIWLIQPLVDKLQASTYIYIIRTAIYSGEYAVLSNTSSSRYRRVTHIRYAYKRIYGMATRISDRLLKYKREFAHEQIWQKIKRGDRPMRFKDP